MNLLHQPIGIISSFAATDFVINPACKYRSKIVPVRGVYCLDDLHMHSDTYIVRILLAARFLYLNVICNMVSIDIP